jgi:hypothetical protein
VFNALNHVAMKRAINDKLTQCYKLLLQEGDFSDFPEEAQQILSIFKIKQEKCKDIFNLKYGKYPLCFFTINFKPDFDNNVQGVYNVMKDLTKNYKYLLDTDWIYTIEQRSDTEEEIKGVHVHILFVRIESPKRITDMFKKKFFDEFVGTHAALDFQFVSDKQKDDKVKYILGIKEKKKMDKVYIDRIWRERESIPHYICTPAFNEYVEQYISNHPDDCKHFLLEKGIQLAE